ncbi:MAG: hypothetical protein JOY69_08785, partial [Candidatus Eremiobacteraeota bacterium]|nr:hypothetical protein [Candidatus Eremiobacteraeota bacterium]
AGLIADASGNLYGAAQQGGYFLGPCPYGCGTVFELRATKIGWTYTILHAFVPKDGIGPTGSMAFDAAGNLYGTAIVGGDLSACQGGGCGSVFKLARRPNGKWAYTILHAFAGMPDGYEPGGIVAGADGNLYGTTRGGGASGVGAVFEVTP